MIKQRKTWQDNITDAIWQLTNSASQLQGLNGYEGIKEEIIILRDKLRAKQDGKL
jgi:hypothetical protein